MGVIESDSICCWVTAKSLEASPLPLVPNQWMRKPGVRSFCVLGDSNCASPCLHAMTCTHSPALPTKKIVSFAISLKPFSDQPGNDSALPRKPPYVSHKPFHTHMLWMWHHYSQHGTQIWAWGPSRHCRTTGILRGHIASFAAEIITGYGDIPSSG